MLLNLLVDLCGLQRIMMEMYSLTLLLKVIWFISLIMFSSFLHFIIITNHFCKVIIDHKIHLVCRWIPVLMKKQYLLFHFYESKAHFNTWCWKWDKQNSNCHQQLCEMSKGNFPTSQRALQSETHKLQETCGPWKKDVKFIRYKWLSTHVCEMKEKLHVPSRIQTM